MGPTPDAIERLAGKIGALDLDAEERAVLDGVLARAAALEPDDDVSGFSSFNFGGLSTGGQTWAAGLGLRPRPGGGGPRVDYGGPNG